MKTDIKTVRLGGCVQVVISLDIAKAELEVGEGLGPLDFRLENSDDMRGPGLELLMEIFEASVAAFLLEVS